MEFGSRLPRSPKSFDFEPWELNFGFEQQYKRRFLHVVASNEGEVVHVITAYEPKPVLWSEDFRKRIK
mgnify:CR=1 FL=1